MKALGIILAGGNSRRMGELSSHRAIPAMPIAGTFRAIDFVLSNMTNSRIQKVAVLTQYNARSLNEHLNSGKWWDFGRKQGGLYVFTPILTADNSDWYRGTADALYQNLQFLKESHEPYVIIASGDAVYKLDYGKILDEHIARRADITVVCKKMPENMDISRFGQVVCDAEGRITEFSEKPMVRVSDLISCGIYVIRRRLLIELIERAAYEERFDFVNDILIRYKNLKHIYAYCMEGYWNNISTITSYYNCNMDFLRPEIRRWFFGDGAQVYSKTVDLPPAKYNPGVNVRNSLIADGSIINSTVEDSVVFRQAFIGNGSVIRNSIILNDVYIGDNAVIENCIVESHSTIQSGSRYEGAPGAPKIVVEENERFVL